MKKMLFVLASALFLAACHQAPKAPYTASQYDSLMIQVMKEKDSALKSMLHNQANPAAFADKGKYYGEKFSALNKEKMKYYSSN